MSVQAYWTNFQSLRQRGPTTGPRATCGPRAFSVLI